MNLYPSTSLTILSILLVFSNFGLAQVKDENNRIENTQEEVIDVVGKTSGDYTEITEDTQKLIELPGTFGDPINAISALPGVIIPAGGSEPAIRGSSPADNRYYIDGLPAAYVFHEFNTSILDKQSIQDFSLYTAGFGAEYSNSTGAVIDIRLRDPVQKPIETTLSASLLRAGVFVEGEVTDNSAFYFSSRAGLLSLFLPEDDEDENTEEDNGIKFVSPPKDHDFLFKYLWHINQRSRFTMTIFGAGDSVEADLNEQANFVAINPDFAGTAKFKNQFSSGGITWQHQFKNNSSLQLITASSNEREALSYGEGYFENFELTQHQLRAQYASPLYENHSIVAGAEVAESEFIFDTRTVLFICTEFDVFCADSRQDIVSEKFKEDSYEYSLYFIDKWLLMDDLQLELGLQYFYNEYLDESHVNPRVSMQYYLTDSIALTSSAGKYNRFADLFTILPELGNPQLDGPTSEHYTLGLKGQHNLWNWSVETYHKVLENLPLALSKQDPNAKLLYSNEVEGIANGVDILVNRAEQNGWYAWASLSYSNSERTNLRTKETFQYRFDTPLVFNLVGNLRLGQHWSFGLRFLAKSGEANTKIVGIRTNPNFPDNYLPVYDEPFKDRLPTYYRLDLRFQRDFQFLGNNALFFVDILNALNRTNVVARELDFNKVKETQLLHIEEEADIGLFPSIGIEVSF